MKLQKLLSLVRQAVDRYGMIETGDRSEEHTSELQSH